MNDCVAQSFPKRQFDGVFLAGDAVQPSISRIKRSTIGEMALSSLGVRRLPASFRRRVCRANALANPCVRSGIPFET